MTYTGKCSKCGDVVKIVAQIQDKDPRISKSDEELFADWRMKKHAKMCHAKGTTQVVTG